MATWNEVLAAAPEIGRVTQERIESVGMAMLATLRRDGYPRISGIETSFRGGELWLGMMTGSLKAKDLQRDPRMCLHNATEDKDVKQPDVKIFGRAVEVDDPAMRQQLRDETLAESGQDPGDDFHLFRIDVTEVSTLRPNVDHLIIESWKEGEQPKSVKRY
jgi:nitroimidazol reductase NimA-like FMN-containing flavoprotein (pyridoxamine 5'-phosphate oxidase superfamily)